MAEKDQNQMNQTAAGTDKEHVKKQNQQAQQGQYDQYVDETDAEHVKQQNQQSEQNKK